MEEFPTREAALAAVRTLISFIGDDPCRPGLAETPERFLRAWAQDWGSGYGPLPANLVKMFESIPFNEKGLRYVPMVIVKDISFFSTCEHHLAPFFGTVAIGYVPNLDLGYLGISKFARIVELFSRRLQTQERLIDNIAAFLEENVSKNVAVTMQATHTCMVSRGVKQPKAQTVTSALRGDFYDDAPTRAEFFRAIGQ